MNRPRGLCWSCYYTPGVKEQYPSTSKYAVRGVGNGMNCTAQPPEPTAVPPGPDKVAILAERAARGEQLFHEGDAIV